MFRLKTVSWIAVSLLFLAIRTADAGDCSCRHCGKNDQQRRLVKKTVIVPVKVVEQRVRNRIIEVEEEREFKCTVFKQVPKERTIKCEYWYLDDKIEQQEVTTKKCMIVNMPVEAEENILVPVKEHYCGPDGCMCTRTTLVESTKKEKKSQPTLVSAAFSKMVDYCVKTPKKHSQVKEKQKYFELEPVIQKKKKMVCVPKVVREVYEVEVWKDMERTVYVCSECQDK